MKYGDPFNRYKSCQINIYFSTARLLYNIAYNIVKNFSSNDDFSGVEAGFTNLNSRSPFTSISALKIAVNQWIDHEADAISNYGPINTWLFSSDLKDMSELFKNTTDFDTSTFNDNISSWDVRNVVNMRKIFYDNKNSNMYRNITMCKSRNEVQYLV